MLNMFAARVFMCADGSVVRLLDYVAHIYGVQNPSPGLRLCVGPRPIQKLSNLHGDLGVIVNVDFGLNHEIISVCAVSVR